MANQFLILISSSAQIQTHRRTCNKAHNTYSHIQATLKWKLQLINITVYTMKMCFNFQITISTLVYYHNNSSNVSPWIGFSWPQTSSSRVVICDCVVKTQIIHVHTHTTQQTGTHTDDTHTHTDLTTYIQYIVTVTITNFSSQFHIRPCQYQQHQHYMVYIH